MQLIMNDDNIRTIEQVKQFLGGSKSVKFEGASIEERYRWIEKVLVRFTYQRLSKAEKGVIRQYIEKMSGYSRAQVCRLIGKFKQRGYIRKADCNRRRFPIRYSAGDIALLARTDEVHDF